MNQPLNHSDPNTEFEIEFVSSHAIRAEANRLALRKKRIALAAAVLFAGALVYAHEAQFGPRDVLVDNAYVGAEVAELTPLAAGP